MGLLDPKLDKKRTFELLRKKGAVKAVLGFSGGNDEGDVYSIRLYDEAGEKQDLEVWYCGGYGYDAKAQTWIPMSEPATEDQELSDLLQGPINEKFGSWGGVDYTSGELEWDVAAGTAKMNYTQDEPTDHEETY